MGQQPEMRVTEKQKSETRKIKLHASMIYDIISKQSGTLEKAFAELIINSVDAGASRCDLTIGEKGFRVADDGKGFVSRKEIEDFFETFGTPHTEGDAKFGRHRIGRGQVMAYGSTIWRSGPFEMRVDVKNMGVDYELHQHAEQSKGCTIDGILYQPLDRLRLGQLIAQLTHLIEFVELPVFINGQQVNQDLSQIKWDIDDEDCRLLVKSSGGMRLYNMGMFVTEHHARFYGGHGVLISKNALELNWARTSILENKCKVYPRILETVRAYYSDHLKKKPSLTVEDRESIWLSVREGRETIGILFDTPMFRLSNGHYKTGSAFKRQFSVAKEGSPIADRLIQDGIATVLSPWTVEQAGSVQDIENILFSMEVFTRFVDFELLADEHDESYQVLAMGKLEANQLAAISAVRKANGRLKTVHRKRVMRDYKRSGTVFESRHELRAEADHELLLGTRKIVPGTSHGLAIAWTDGESQIVFDIDRLTEMLDRGPSGALEVVHTLVHEYAHNESSGQTHVHGPEFHELFHDLAMADVDGLAAAADLCCRTYLSDNKDLRPKVVSAYLNHLDRQTESFQALESRQRSHSKRAFDSVLDRMHWKDYLSSEHHVSYFRSEDPLNDVQKLRLAEQRALMGERSRGATSTLATLEQWRHEVECVDGGVARLHPAEFDRLETFVEMPLQLLLDYQFSGNSSSWIHMLDYHRRKSPCSPDEVVLSLNSAKLHLHYGDVNLREYGKALPELIYPLLDLDTRRTWCVVGIPRVEGDRVRFPVAASYVVPPWEWPTAPEAWTSLKTAEGSATHWLRMSVDQWCEERKRPGYSKIDLRVTRSPDSRSV